MTKIQNALVSGFAMVLTVPGCMMPANDPAPGSSQEALTATTNAMGAIGTLGQTASIVVDESANANAQAVQPDGGGDAAPEGIEGGSCVSAAWTIFDPLHLAIDMDSCVLPDGQTIDGRIDGWLQYQGVQGSFGLGFDRLSVGSQTLTGLLVGSAIEPEGARFALDADFADAATGLGLVLDGAVVEIVPDVVTLDGAGSVAAGPDLFAVQILDTLRWDDPTSCYPTTGRLSVSGAGQPAIEATFVVTESGPAVDAQLLPPPAAPVRMALPPCGSNAE